MVPIRSPRLIALSAALVVIGLVVWAVRSRPATPVSSGPAAATRAVSAAPPARFVDFTAEAGLGGFIRVNGAEGEKLLPETTGGGGAFVDVDNDGDLDVVLVNGRRWPWSPTAGAAPASTVSLFTNDGRGHFTDATTVAGLAVKG